MEEFPLYYTKYPALLRCTGTNIIYPDPCDAGHDESARSTCVPGPRLTACQQEAETTQAKTRRDETRGVRKAYTDLFIPIMHPELGGIYENRFILTSWARPQ